MFQMKENAPTEQELKEARADVIGSFITFVVVAASLRAGLCSFSLSLSLVSLLSELLF